MELTIEQQILINNLLGYNKYTLDKLTTDDEREKFNMAQIWFNERSQKATNRFFSFLISCLLIITVITSNFKPGQNFCIFIIFVTVALLSFISIYLYPRGLLMPKWISYYKIPQEQFEEKVTGNVVKWYNLDRNLFFSVLYIKPFKFQFVWWWTLVIGIINISSEYIDKGYGITFQPSTLNQKVFADYSISLLKAIIISIISFIASNIIRELWNLRDDYSKSASNFATIKYELAKASEEVVKFTNVLELKEIDDNYTKFIGHLNLRKRENQAILGPAKDEFKKSLKSLFESFDGKLTEKPFVDFWLLSGLANYIKISSELFEQGNLIITKFEVFAELLRNSLTSLIRLKSSASSNVPDFEIFTTIVLPPDRFFNYSKEDEVQEKWFDYLNINMEAKRHNIKQHRHFIWFPETIDRVQYHDKYFLSELNRPEIEPLLEGKFVEKLKLSMKCKDDGALQIEGNKFAVCAEQVEHCKPVYKAIKDYHCDGCAKVIKIDLTNENVEHFFDILIDKETFKPIDYYAIKQGSEWVFCFKAIYDKSYNTAALRLYNEEYTHWERIKNDLDVLFTIKNIDEITTSPADRAVFESVRTGTTILEIEEFATKQ